ncbi:putative WD repeat-containing protein [Penicillium rolfsii]|nr:putative WD repeat-containing protein [Penicillium rolfsii]
MHTLKATAASSLGLPAENYIYTIAASAPGSFAAISSDDSLRVFDAATLGRVSVISNKTHDAGVTSLRSFAAGESQLLATGGREGKVKLWDVRAGNAVVEVETARHAPVLSVACNSESHTIVAGTELLSSQAVVTFWDIRSPQAPRLQYVESHNDDITELQYHPTRSNILLSGSTDGLVNVYDTSIADEDEALVQVINHGSVHHAGFLSERTIYALSHDEQFSVHPATDPDDSAQEPEPVHFEDVREPLGCEYVVQLCLGAQGPYIAAGNKIDKRLDLIPLVSTPTWRFDQDNLWRLPGAHGEEVVRSVYLDEQSQSVFTCGEDGFVRAWKPVEGGDEEVQNPAGSGKISRPKDKKQKDRFKPY